MKKKITVIGIICMLMLTVSASTVSADDNETIKERIDQLRYELAQFRIAVWNDLDDLDHEEYPHDDPARGALYDAVRGLDLPLHMLDDIFLSIGEINNKQIKLDIYVTIHDIKQLQGDINGDLIRLTKDEGYDEDEPPIVALADAADGLTYFIETLEDIYDSVEVNARSSFREGLSRIFENNPIILKLIQILFKL